MTVSELIERLQEFNCPDSEVRLINGYPDYSDVRLSDTGNDITIGVYTSPEINDTRRFHDLVEELKRYSSDIESALDDLNATIDDLEELEN